MGLERGTLEERFWANVWRCTYRWPCKTCCWPWWPEQGTDSEREPAGAVLVEA